MFIKILAVFITLSVFYFYGCGNSTPQRSSNQVDTTAQQMKITESSSKQKINDLINQAKDYVNEGKYQEAISAAQNILNFDVNNLEAKKIIDDAREKLKQKAEETNKMQSISTSAVNALIE